MQANKFFKALIIALPMFTMMACTSNDDTASMSDAEANQMAAEQAEQDRMEREAKEKAAIAEKAQEARNIADIERRKNLETLRNNNVVYFDFDTSNLSADAYDKLDQHAKYLTANPNQSIVIEGHADSRGTPEYNIALGERRAKSVETFLLNSGASASQISVVSYGEEKPVATGSSESAFAQNRRGVLVYQ